MYKQLSYQVLRMFIVILIIISCFFFIKYAFIYLYPIFFAIILSFFLNPFVSFLEMKLKFPRPLATIAVIATILVFIIGVLFFIVTEIVQGTEYLAEKVPVHFHTFTALVDVFINNQVLPLYHKLTSLFHTLDSSQQLAISENIRQLINQISTSGAALFQGFLLNIPNVLSVLPNSFTIFIFILLATFFITNDWISLKHSLNKFVPEVINQSIKHIIEQLKKALYGFVKAQLILISITAALLLTGLLILNIEHALTIALLAAAIDLLPYIGTGFIFLPWITYLFFTGHYSMTISLTVLYMVVVVTRQVLEPKILSSSIGINPLAALVTLFLSIQIWGLPGLLVAPILLIFLNALYRAGIFRRVLLFIRG
ncbi:sporulation integral membrane protein YtvI [Virgibacillus sp. C22-A2]|uniref:Sporulation integral membrane protein YtvI n=1 Tax=Virgibacillus tibetensis TaxID=3042313 RepID=A0ABU6K9A3_9BACI|nr:sporulation integral membrane protein YtvI [Virgibacillus sp. C22-A2]